MPISIKKYLYLSNLILKSKVILQFVFLFIFQNTLVSFVFLCDLTHNPSSHELDCI
jgi:hypothetical protein